MKKTVCYEAIKQIYCFFFAKIRFEIFWSLSQKYFSPIQFSSSFERQETTFNCKVVYVFHFSHFFNESENSFTLLLWFAQSVFLHFSINFHAEEIEKSRKKEKNLDKS